MRSFLALSAAAGLVLALGGCQDGSAPVGPDASSTPASEPHFDHNGVGDAEFGTTLGWRDGETVEFFYHKNFFCKEPPESGAPSGCEAGAEAMQAPRGGNIPVLYVMTPIGFRPEESTLQCPEVGSCINHPSTIDLSRVFLSADFANVPLPAHSHIVDRELKETNGGQAGWWELEVVGVTDPAVWAQVVAGRSLATVRELQEMGQGITGDVPTNAFLFFGVRPLAVR
jgi:hypothetical protein